MHQGLSAEEVARICIDCKADVIVVESEALLKRVLLVQHKLPELKCIVQWRGEPPLSDQRRLAKSHKMCTGTLTAKERQQARWLLNEV